MSGLRTGYTTGTCAACAAGAAVGLLLGEDDITSGSVTLPDGERIALPVEHAERGPDYACIGVRKDAGDDPDDTDGMMVVARVFWQEGQGISFAAGPGVGTVTKPGLAISVGEPAINPVPRRMIVRAIREKTDRGVGVTISIPGGADIAQKTFNPKLGIIGGLSILGTSGRVVPFSCPAIRESLRCVLRVAVAGGTRHPVFVPGNTGARAARHHFCFHQDALVRVANEWGVMLDEAKGCDCVGLLALGHPGKLAKLVDGHFQTHSKNSPSALPIVRRLADFLSIPLPLNTPTVEGCFAGLSPGSRSALATHLAAAVKAAIDDRIHRAFATAVVLVNMNGDLLGAHGDLSPWSA